MIVSYSQIIGSNILCIDEQAALGKVADIVLQKSDMKIKALLLHSAFFFVPPKVVIFDDITDFDRKAVIVQKEDDIVPINELVSVKQTLKAKMHGVRQRVYTKSGKYLGTVYDYTIDSASGLIYSIYVKHLLSDRILPRTVIRELNQKGYIVDDDYELISSSAPVPESA